MSKSSVPLLLAGFVAGFLVMYLIARDRDPGPVVIRDPSLLSPAPAATQADREMLSQLESRLTGAPSDLPILTDLASLSWNIEDFAQAVVWYQRAIDLAPNDADLRTDLGTALYYDDRLEEAVAAFESALAIDPDHPQALINLGIALLDGRGDQAGAVALWERFVAAHPDHPRAEAIREEIRSLEGR